MIGTMEEAQRAYAIHHENESLDDWSVLGRGSTRTAYLSPSGVVYKVCHSYGDGSSRSWNGMEHGNFIRISKSRKLPKNWRVPKSDLLVFKREDAQVEVLTCEYVPGERPEYDEEVSEKIWQAFSSVGLRDAGTYNTIVTEDGTWLIIDAAETDVYPDAE